MARTASTRKSPKKTAKAAAIKAAPSSQSASGSQGFPIIGVGASAGGMEAFMQLLRGIPNNITCSFVYVSHLDPKFKSELDSVLQRETKLIVKTVTNSIRIEPGHVYVLAPDREMRLQDGMLVTEQRRR